MTATRIHLVLVRPIYPRNIGACARALANMGGHELILIDPQCEINHQAREGAAGAQQILQNHQIYSSWTEFYTEQGQGLRIALSRRDGKNRNIKSLTDLTASFRSPKNLYLILGPEDDGLSTEDMAFCNHCCFLPTFGEFCSMNLAQAALLGLYICQEALGANPNRPKSATVLNRPQPLVFPDRSIRLWLETMGFDIQARRSSAYKTLRRILLQNEPTSKELMILESVLQQNIRRLKQGQTKED